MSSVLRLSRTRVVVVSLLGMLVALMSSFALASGGGSKPPAHGEAKKGGHGEAKKDAAKKPAHGEEKKPAHGEAKKSSHGAEKKSGHGEAKKGEGEEAKVVEKPDPTFAPDLVELLQLIDSKKKKNDPLKFVELDLGSYQITHSSPVAGKMAKVLFHLYAIVPEDKLTEVSDKIPTREQRMRDAILSVVHEATTDELNEPEMYAVKERLIVALNRTLDVAEVRDVVFSELSTRRLY